MESNYTEYDPYDGTEVLEEPAVAPTFEYGDVVGYDAETPWYTLVSSDRTKQQYIFSELSNGMAMYCSFSVAHKMFIKIDPGPPAPIIKTAPTDTVRISYPPDFVYDTGFFGRGILDTLQCKHEWVDTGMRKTWCKKCDKDHVHE